MGSVETQHEAHHHASRRLVVGVGAVVVVALAAAVWVLWGDEIKEACTGNDGACPIDLGVATGTIAPVDSTAFTRADDLTRPDVSTSEVFRSSTTPRSAIEVQ